MYNSSINLTYNMNREMIQHSDCSSFFKGVKYCACTDICWRGESLRERKLFSKESRFKYLIDNK